MRFVSTRGRCDPASLKVALFDGLAPDGGLYMPERYPVLSPELLERLRGASREEIALETLMPYLAEVPGADLTQLVSDAFDFEIPLVKLTEELRVLELFHGPTKAFKDVGARFMARLMAWFLKDEDRELTILVATSGDTGSAVAQAFLGVPRTKAVILYPEGKVSPLQQKQFTTLGENVQAITVAGTFDDCQRMVKEAFGDQELRGKRWLTSANSINVGRLLPQAFYYFYAASRLPRDSRPLVISTPSGNFGNLCGGLIAKRMGMRCERFVAATNINDVVPEYLESGRFTPRSSIPTISNAMDVGDPSNLARIISLYEEDLEAIRSDIRGSRHDDDETRRAIREVSDRHGYVFDPHTAVGFLGLREAMAEAPEGAIGVLLATAHPAKFREEVEPVIGETIRLPESLARCLERPSRTISMAADTAALKSYLLETS
jgi:threonine synthase